VSQQAPASEVLGTAPQHNGAEPSPAPRAQPLTWAGRLLHPAGLAVGGFSLALSGLLGLNGGTVQRLADAIVALTEPTTGITPEVIGRGVTQAQVILMLLAVLLAGLALWRSRDDNWKWWQSLAGTAVLLAVIVVGINLFADLAVTGEGFTQ
jgi:hypothetical protein